MAGHSKWANIKHRKGRQDAARNRVFGKIMREVTVAARIGGGDIDANPRLRLAVDKARAANMPKDNVTRAIAKASGEGAAESFEEVIYEGYAAHGVALMIEVITDNKNRTTPEIRHMLSKYGGNLGTDGSVAWIFETKGIIVVNREGADEDKLMEVALEAGAEDIIEESNFFEVRTAFETFEAVNRAIEAAGFEPESAEISKIPLNTVALDEAAAKSVLKLYDLLNDHDDVQKVHANFDVSDEILEALSA